VRLAVLAALAACADRAPIEIELPADGEVTRTFDVDGARQVRVIAGGGAPIVVEAWAEGGAIAEAPEAQLAAGAPASWLAPRAAAGELAFEVLADGEVALTVWARGAPPPASVARERSLAWLDGALLDEPGLVSMARVLAAIASAGGASGGAGGSGTGTAGAGRLLERWFQAFAAGPGAGRAAFAQLLAELAAAQGPDPAAWDLAALPFRATGVHNRVDLARGRDCGELRASFASTHATFAPVHLIFLFRQVPAPDDVTPDGAIHCRGTARRWAGLTALDPAAFRAAARELLERGLAGDRFVMAESVELTISPWQWRQWVPDGAGGLANPPLFQTLDVPRVNAPGPTRDAFLAQVAEHAPQIDARAWEVPAAFRAPIAEVPPNAVAPLVDLAPLAGVLAAYPALPRSLGMIGCPRCHTDDADFIQTGADRRPSPFYDKELDARARRLEAYAAGAWPPPPPFGPLQPL
jgi:hypothetical protein